MRILLVEDEPSAARFIAKGLREAKHAVDLAADGTAVAEQCQQNDYDAVILDVMLPGKDGVTVCRELRAARTITATTPDSRLTVPAGTRELEQLAESFNRVLDHLGSALSTQRRFMADASHELRTPVSIMRTAADVTLGAPSRDVP